MADSIATRSLVYYFGALHEYSGHFLHDTGLVHRYPSDALPDLGIAAIIDQGFCPPGPQVQSKALLTHRGGWTILAMWDRTGDSRPGSNSVFVVEGEMCFADVCEIIRREFGFVWDRISAAAPIELW